MKCLIFTEGGMQIGYGHIVRCSCIYDILVKKGIDVRFVINGDIDVFSILKSIKFEIVDWTNIENLNKLLGAEVISIVDSYIAQEKVYEYISKYSKRAMFIDDNARLSYPKGIVLSPTIYSDELNYNHKEDVTYMKGSKYILLREEFMKTSPKNIRKEVREVMLSFGGSDIKNLTPKVLSALNNRYPNLLKNVVIGKNFNNINEIEKLVNDNVKLYYDINDKGMKALMINSDLAIIAAGQTMHELAKLGVPTIAICVAENQKRNTEKFYNMGLIKEMDIYNQKKLYKNFDSLLEYEERKKINLKLNNMDIGKNVHQAVDFLISGLL